MSDPAEIIAKALRDAQVPQNAPTRLATVTGGTATTISVRFDGEANASPRAYVKTYNDAQVGDRVIMLAVGSTWVAVARLGDPLPTVLSTSVPAFGAYTSASSVWRASGITTCVVNVTATANNGAGAACALIPAGFRPPTTMYFWAADGATGTQVLMYVDSSGGIYHTFARNTGQNSYAYLTYVTTG